MKKIWITMDNDLNKDKETTVDKDNILRAKATKKITSKR